MCEAAGLEYLEVQGSCSSIIKRDAGVIFLSFFVGVVGGSGYR